MYGSLISNHPHLLPSYSEKVNCHLATEHKLIKNPSFHGKEPILVLIDQDALPYWCEGPYGPEGFILPKFQRLPNLRR